jgi:GMP synthase (glutamine-hydrolysing)
MYKNKNIKFNTPAFNFDEVITMPENSILLASNPINKVQSLNFKVGECDIWGLQYHPEITYNKMINLIIFRKKRLLDRGAFEDENEINNHIKDIEEENKKLDKLSRMRELENWLDYLNLE